MSITNFVNTSIHSYLSDKIYHIPDYQREYSWDEEQLEDFWQDLTNTVIAKRHHFYGQVVVHQNEADGKYYIIDGQQRTTTAVIFLAAVRDWLKEFAETNDEAQNKVEDIRIKYIGRYSIKSDELRLHLGISDRVYFRDNIQRGAPKDADESPSQKRICTAYEYFVCQLRSVMQGLIKDEDKIDELLKYYHALLNDFRLMVVTTDDINEAFVIFETLNARGKDLETSDLLKNFVFMTAGQNIEIIKNSWMRMNESLANRDDATKYIRYFWNSHNRFVREKGLYREICTAINSGNCEQFVSELADLTELYNALEKPEDFKYFSSSALNEILVQLSVLKMKTFYPIIFAAVRANCSENDILKVLRSIETLAFRNMVVAGFRANKYEQRFSSIAYRLSNGESTIGDVLTDIRLDTVDDEQLVVKLKGLEIRSVSIAKYILRELEDLSHPEKKTTRNNTVINLEHIMPKNNGIWLVDEDIHKRNLYRLANQTIMLEEFNKSASNKLFVAKKENYGRSSIQITRDLLEYPEWTVEQMEQRETKMIALMLKRWSLVY